MKRMARALGLSGLLWACDKSPSAAPAPSAVLPASSYGAPAVSNSSSPHAEHDCSVAHPAPSARAIPTATTLNPQARERITTLRISAKVGSVIVRKTDQGWALAGPHGCTVSEARMAKAFEVLSALTAEPTNERPTDFELQVIVQSGEERMLHLDVAGEKAGRHLVQLHDGSTFHIGGLDRELLAADPRVWCAPE